MADPLSVVGAISACIAIAQFIAEQVQKWIDAPQKMKAIRDNSNSMQSFLSQLGDTIQIDTRAALTAPRLPGKSVKSAYETIRDCQGNLLEIERILYNVLGQRRIDSSSSFENYEVRARFRRYESDLNDLQASLKDYELHIVLINSILMLNLQRQPVEMHPLDRREVDNLTMTVGLIWNTINGKTHASGTQSKTSVSPSGTMSATTKRSPSDTRGPPGDEKNAPNTIDRGSIARVDRTRISTQALDARGVKWLNDPFDTSLINLYDVSDEELTRLVRKKKYYGTSSSHHRTRSSRTSNTGEQYRLGLEEMEPLMIEARKEKDQMSASEMRRMEEEMKEKLYVAEQQGVRLAKSPVPQHFFRSDQELVNFILDGWELSSSSPDKQLKVSQSGNQQNPKSRSPRRSSAVEKTSPCGYIFRKGEPMYHCHDCCFRDQVFCAECFDLRVHAGHLTETNPAEDNRSYCDCDPNETVRRDMICSMHKTKMLGSSTVN